MEKKYQLKANEFFVMSNDRARYDDTMGELILTNLNLVFIKSKMRFFKTIYVADVYPLKQIKVLNNRARLILSKDNSIKIDFINGLKTFELWTNDIIFSRKKAKKEAMLWIENINQLISGQVPEPSTAANYSNDNAELIAESVKDTFDKVKGILFGTKIKKMLSKRCISCEAPISGTKGQLVTCYYCDTRQEL